VYFFEGAGTDTIYAIVEGPTQSFGDNQSGAAGADYRIQITAVDDSGRATSESVVRTGTDSQCPSPCRIVSHLRSSTGPSIDPIHRRVRVSHASTTVNTDPDTALSTEAFPMTTTSDPTFVAAAQRRVGTASGWSNASGALAIRAA